MKKMRAIFTLVGFFVAIFLLYIIFFTSPATPWEKTGTLSILTRTVPGLLQDTSMVLGIDDMQLYRDDGEIVHVTIRTRRIELVPGNDTLTLVVDANVPIGNYTGFGFTLRSPELRNSWQGDIAPKHVTLIGDIMKLDVPYNIEEDITSSIILAFETLSAIHAKENTKIYLPVVQIETRKGSSIYTDTESGLVSVQGGVIQNSATFGMDWNALLRYNFRAKALPTKQEEEEIETVSTSTIPESTTNTSTTQKTIEETNNVATTTNSSTSTDESE